MHSEYTGWPKGCGEMLEERTVSYLALGESEAVWCFYEARKWNPNE